MTNVRRLLPLLLLPLVIAPACDEDPDADPTFGEPPPEEVFGAEFRGWGYSGSTVQLNTNIVNGSAINTVRFGLPSNYGAEVAWIYSVALEEFLDIDTVTVIDGAVQGYTESGVFASTLSFDGSFWYFAGGGIDTYTILEDVRYASEVGLANEGSKLMTTLDPNRFVYKWSSPYAHVAGTKVDSKTGWGGTWDGLHTCATDDKGGVWSVMYRGMLVNEATGDVTSASWAPQEYAYIACLSGRIGKTSLWGYAPDNPSASRPDLTLDEFEGAHRMVGAEYCGDGRSYTRPGEAVTLRDKWNINQHQVETTSEEAVWSVNGAVCLGTPRWEYYSTASSIVCSNGKVIPTCNTATSASTHYNLNTTAKWWARNAFFPD